MKLKLSCFFLSVFLTGNLLSGQQNANNPDREQWFMDMGFGMFIHWSMDSQVGAVISHSMAGASEDYLGRFENDLPKTFNP